MRLRRPNVKAALPALSVIFVVAAAAVVWHNLPTPTDLYGPFDVHAEAGSPAVGRAVTATVTAVRARSGRRGQERARSRREA